LTNAVLLDTHIALWLDSGDERLRPTTRDLIDVRWRNGATVLISAVSAWEIALLVDAGRIDLDCPVEAWIDRFVDRPGIETIPLSSRAASRAYRLHELEHRDPADRLLIATAIEQDCPLITYDSRIVRFGEQHGSQYGFKVEG
jgi:PIN domain nuclease of toxin-antitoxin system